MKSVIILLLARLAAVAAGGRAGRARARGAAARRALGGAGAGAARAAAVGITGAGHDGLSEGVLGVLGWGTRAERIKARGEFSNKLRKYTVKKPRCPHASSAWIRTLRYHDSALSRQISRAGPCALAARGACWRTLGTTKAGEYWRRCARGNGYSARRIRALSGLKKLGPRSEAKTRKQRRGIGMMENESSVATV